MEEINYVLTGDNNYVDQMLVVMTSIVLNQRTDKKAHFYLFMKNIKEGDEELLNEITYRYDCSLSIIHAEQYEHFFSEIDEKKFANSYINIVCYYRLLMLKFLPPSVKKCFYVDGDMIVKDDLVWIWDEMTESDILSTVVEIHAMENRESILSHLYKWPEFSNFIDNPQNYPYFNAGFYLLNVDLAIRRDLWSKAMDFIKNHPNPPYADQDTLNAIIGQARPGNVRFLPPHFNVFCDMSIDYNKRYCRSYYDPDFITDSFKFAKILHFAGGLKPWDYNNCHYYSDWWEYAAKSPAAGSLLLKGQDVHSNLCKELYYVKSENNKLLNQTNTNKSKKIASKVLSRCNSIDPIILYRYNRCGIGGKSYLSKAFVLSKLVHEAKNGVNSEHNIDLKNIKKKIDKCEIVSFDIFDTLVNRPFVNPIDVFRYIEKISNRKGYADDRINAERLARHNHSTQEEVTLDQIYECLSIHLDLKELEKAVEADIQCANPVIKEIYDYAKGQGKEIIITSDMYLPLDTISAILSNCGYSEYSHIYLSSERMHMKMNGTLFQDILQDLNVGPEKIVHIGDNLWSDYEVPKKMGITAIHITKNIDALLESDYRAQKMMATDNSLEASVLLAVISTFREKNKKYWTDFGIRYAGPVIAAYAKWISDRFVENDIHTAFFIARDGYTLMKAVSKMNPNVDMHYVYCPRHISNVCNMDIEEKIKTDRNEAEPAVRSIIRYYESYYSTEVTLDSYESQVEFIKTHLDEIRNISNSERERYAKYVASLTQSKEIALIDTITIYYSSQKLISEALHGVNVVGYYWTIVKTDNNGVKIATYPSQRFQKEYGFATKDWDVMEFFITSPEPPIYDIDVHGKPIYKEPTEYDSIRSRIYPDLSDGELIFVDRYLECAGKLKIDLSAEVINNYLDIINDCPTERDKKMFESVKHPYDSENSKFVPLFKNWYK